MIGIDCRPRWLREYENEPATLPGIQDYNSREAVPQAIFYKQSSSSSLPASLLGSAVIAVAILIAAKIK